MLQVEVTRAQVVESTHVVRACATDVDGELIGEASPGDGDWKLFLRSAAKPFQAAPAAAAGVIERLGLADRHLAIGCASHDGSPAAVRLVREILAAAGLGDFDVHTGDDGQGGLVKHQCSGNHALALAMCVVQGWPVDGYLDRTHPVQEAMQEAVADAVGVEPELEPDNCGMITHRVPLRAMATAYARLGIGWSGLAGLDLVAAAMRANPYVVRQAGQGDAELMASSAALVAKFGAECAVGIGSDSGVGAAMKVVDGGLRAWGTAAVAVTKRWIDPTVRGPAIDAIETVTLLDGAGRPIGRLHATWD